MFFTAFECLKHRLAWVTLALWVLTETLQFSHPCTDCSKISFTGAGFWFLTDLSGLGLRSQLSFQRCQQLLLTVIPNNLLEHSLVLFFC